MDLGKPLEIIEVPEPAQIPDHPPAETVPAAPEPAREPVPA